MKSQRQKLKDLLEFREGQWIPLIDILSLGIAQYNARILELRREGMHIENKTEKRDGKKHSWYRYVKPVKEDLFIGG